MANRFLAALAYGLESRLTQALDVAAVSDPWAAIEQSLAPVVGSAAPATGAAVQEITEPGPDIETGQLEKGFGDRLVMGVVSEPIFAGDPSQDEPVQGYLLNCPLAAVLCAMAHTPVGRKRIRGMVRRRRSLQPPTPGHRVLHERRAGNSPRARPVRDRPLL